MELIHWRYFLSLEEDLLRLARFIEFSPMNFKAFSLEMAHLLLAASSEADVVLKMLCKPYNVSADNEQAYRVTLQQHLPKIAKVKIKMPHYDLVVTPWEEWDRNKTPDWWTGYNKVKHHRDSDYDKANLENVLNSMAGLFICNLFLYKDLANKGNLGPWPKLLFPEDDLISGSTPGEGGWVPIWNI